MPLAQLNWDKMNVAYQGGSFPSSNLILCLFWEDYSQQEVHWKNESKLSGCFHGGVVFSTGFRKAAGMCHALWWVNSGMNHGALSAAEKWLRY